MKSLRVKMTILIVLAVLGVSVLVSFISYLRARTSLIAQMEDNYSVAAQKYALELTSWVNTNATIIDTMAAEIAVNDISLQDYDAFHKYLKDSNELLNKNGYVYDVYFTYPNNFMVCASDFLADGTVDFVHEREWYTTSALTGELFFASPYLDSDTKKPIITISKAVYKDGELLGVLAADIFVDVLVEMINQADVGENSYAFLMDHNLGVIAHPSESYAYDDEPIGLMLPKKAPYGILVSNIENDNDDMAFITDYDGVQRGIAYSEMTNTGWYVCIATAREILEKDVRKLMSGFVIATIVAVIIGAVTAIFLARVLDKLSKQEQEYNQHVLLLEKQAADEASRAKSRFLADMSHEIRTPINAILGMNEIIMRETDNNEIKDYSRNIKQSGNNLLQLINGILDFSKIEDGKMEIVPARYRLATQIAYYLSSISDRANAKNVELIFDIDPSLPSELFGDDKRINQVVINLLTNAVKYTEKGSVTFSVYRGEINRETGSVLIKYKVKDTGIGIKESDLSRLFESFERLDVVRNRNIEGTGLGMTITTRLLELMGSKLNVSSVYGKGSEFSFELWQKIENEKTLGDYRKAIKESDEEETYHESFHAPDARILVVDDTNLNILVVTNLLKKTGLRIDTALSGPDSIELTKKYKYDVILMDQRMPGMDGTEAMKIIRGSGSNINKDTPEICLTADVIRGARERYLEQGFDDYLTKPVDGIELEKLLIKYLPDDKLTVTKGISKENESFSEENVSSAWTDNGLSVAEGNFPDKDADHISYDTEKIDGILAYLKKAGIETEKGIIYCQDDREFYVDVLAQYRRERDERYNNVSKAYKEKNRKNYEIYVHSLKSSSNTIGALKLSKLAEEMERAVTEGNTDIPADKHELMMKEFDAVISAIDGAFGKQ